MDAHDRVIRQTIDALTAHLAQGKPLRIPEAGRLLWGWYLDLNGTRTYGDAGPHAITYGEIASYSSLMRWPIEPRHVSALRAIDAAWLKRARATSPGGASNKPARAMSVELFDAMFA